MKWIDLQCGYAARSEMGVFLIHEIEDEAGKKLTGLMLFNANGRHDLGFFPDEREAAIIAELMAGVE